MEEIRSVVFSTDFVMAAIFMIAIAGVFVGVRSLVTLWTRRARWITSIVATLVIVGVVWWVVTQTQVV